MACAHRQAQINILPCQAAGNGFRRASLARVFLLRSLNKALGRATKLVGLLANVERVCGQAGEQAEQVEQALRALSTLEQALGDAGAAALDHSAAPTMSSLSLTFARYN